MQSNKKFASKIKDIRNSQNMTIEELAENSNVNLEILKDMEDGKIIPSLTPLTKLSKALGVRLGTFLDDAPQTGPIVVKNGKSDNVFYFSGREDITDSSDLEFHSLGAGKIDRHIEPFIIDVCSKEKDFELSSHEGEEFIYVLEGEIEIEYGKNKYLISKGDSIYYDSVVPHHLHSHQEENAKILAVLYTPFD